MKFGFLSECRAGSFAVACLFLAIGCAREPERGPVRHLGNSLTHWESPYKPPPVEIDLDTLWEPYITNEAQGTTLFAASLPERIAGNGSVLAATVAMKGEKLAVETFEEDTPFEEGVAYVDPGKQQVHSLNALLVNNGTATCTVILHDGPVRITVSARGKVALGIPPEMVVHLNGDIIGRFDVGAKNYHPYTTEGTARKGLNVLGVEFTNDYWRPGGEDRNLYIRDAQFSQNARVFLLRKDPENPPAGVRLRYGPYPLIVDQYAHAEPAPGLKDSPGPWRYYLIGNETRPALPLPPPGEARFRMVLGDGSRVRLAFGVLSTGERYLQEMVVFEVWVEREGWRKKVGRVELDPVVRESDRSWTERIHDLGEFGSGTASLVVNSVSWRRDAAGVPGFDRHLAFLAEPIVITPKKDPSKLRNVVLVSLDTLRADHLSGYGYGISTSPILDRFGSENIVFETAIAQSNWTLPSHVSMLCSLYPSTHGVFRMTQSLRDLETVASVLKRHGYQTAAMTDGGLLSPEYGFPLGFNLYQCSNYSGFEASMPAIRKWLRESAFEPFFLFIHSYDTHDPYQPPKRFRDRFALPDGVSPELADGIPREFIPLRDTAEELAKRPVSGADLQQLINMYDGEIMYVDEQMGVIFDLLKQLDHWDDTLIIVTSDHGEEFLEHGQLKHSKTLYEEIIRVPMMLRIPERRRWGVQVATSVEIIDIPPTIYDYLDLRPRSEPQGKSLLPYLDDSAPAEAFAEDEFHAALRTGNEKLILSFRTGKKDLYDLSTDPVERNNLTAKKTQRAEELAGRLQRFRSDNEAMRTGSPPTEVDLSDQLAEQLKNLGYMQ